MKTDPVTLNESRLPGAGCEELNDAISAENAFYLQSNCRLLQRQRVTD